MRNKWTRHLGYWMMLVAFAIPCFIFGQIVWRDHHQVKAYQDYKQEVKSDDLQKVLTASQTYNEQLNSDNSIVDPFVTEGYDVDYGVMSDTDAIYGYLSIPSLELMEPIYLGASQRHLIMGLAHVDGTSLPLDKKGVRSVIAGHRSEYGPLFFRHLDQLKVGDRIYFDNGQETLVYQMVSSEIIWPSEWDKLLPKKDKNMMTLLTCDPVLVYNKRLIVNFERVVDVETSAQEATTLAFTGSSTIPSKIKWQSIGYHGICYVSFFGMLWTLYRYVVPKRQPVEQSDEKSEE